MKPVPESLFVKSSTHDQLGRGICAAYSRHHPAANLGGYNVSHEQLRRGDPDE